MMFHYVFYIISVKNFRTTSFHIAPIVYVFYSADKNKENDRALKLAQQPDKVDINFRGDTQGQYMVH